MQGADPTSEFDLRTLRAGAGISQALLAERSGISQSRISRIETGIIKASVAELSLLGEACRVEVESRLQRVLQITTAP